MQLGVNVNTEGEPQDIEIEEDIPDFVPPAQSAAGATGDQGPCLYLGSEGQRCDLKAVEGGFCERHRAGGIAASIPPSARIIAAIGLIGILWPYLADLVREIIRLAHSR